MHYVEVKTKAKEMKELDLDSRTNDDNRVKPLEETSNSQLSPKEGQVTQLGSELFDDDLSPIQQTIWEHVDLFAWSATDMPEIDQGFRCYKLAICKDPKPIVQRKRKNGGREVLRIMAGNCQADGYLGYQINDYTTRLSNVVMVKKPNEKWWMCIDYTDLNRACPKDAYPLSNIYHLVDGAAGHKLLSFLDAYFSYNQIMMDPMDENKMTFITKSANYYFKVMPFRLKNDGATYQRMMDKVFKGQLGRTLDYSLQTDSSTSS